MTAKLLDYGTVRFRTGWAFGSFLPYVTLGVSVAQVDLTQTVSIHYSGYSVTSTTYMTTPPVTQFSLPSNVNANYSTSHASNGRYWFGFSAGLGLDYALTRNIFLRGEYEYLQLGTPGNLTLNTSTVRAGAGLKF